VKILIIGEADVAATLASLFWVRVGGETDLNQTLVIDGVSGTERFADPCRLQADLHSQRACHLHSALAHPTHQLHRVPVAREEDIIKTVTHRILSPTALVTRLRKLRKQQQGLVLIRGLLSAAAVLVLSGCATSTIATRAGYRVAEVAVQWVHDPDTRIPYNLRRATKIWLELFRINRAPKVGWPLTARTR
jgi:hypothetical protein